MRGNNPMAKIFISYRRKDTENQVRSLGNALIQHFGKGQVFYDLETIEAGEDWDETVRRTLTGDTIVLAIIGGDWVTATNAAGQRLIEDSDNNNRRELEIALRERLVIIPVLVEGAEIPTSSELPESLQALTHRNAVKYRNDDWHADVDRVIRALEQRGIKPVAARLTGFRAWPPRPVSWLAALAVVTLVVLLALRGGAVPPFAATPQDGTVLAASKPPTMHQEIVIDSSEGMKAAFDGQTKLTAAIAALQPIPLFATDNLALRTLGGECHQDDSSRMVVQFGRNSQKQIKASAERLQPGGQPAFVFGIAAAITDLQPLQDAPRRLIVLTGGDLCPNDDLAEINVRLRAAKLDPKDLDIRFIGLGVSGEREERLRAIANGVGGNLSVVKTMTELNKALQWALQLDPAAAPMFKEIAAVSNVGNELRDMLNDIGDSLNAHDFDDAQARLAAAQTVYDAGKQAFAPRTHSSATFGLWVKTAEELRSSYGLHLKIGQELAGYLQASGGRPDRPDIVDQWNDGIQRWMRQNRNHGVLVKQLNVTLEELRKEARRMPAAP